MLRFGERTDLVTAQRKNYGTQIQQMRIMLDEVSLGTFLPPTSGAYEPYETTFSVSASGTYLLSLKGLVNADQTIFVDNLGIVRNDSIIVR